MCTGEIREIPNALMPDMLEKARCLAFSSKHGVDAFFHQLFLVGMDTRRLAGISVAAVGTGTAERLLTYGIRADLIPEEYHSDAFCETLRNAGFSGEETVLIKVRGTVEPCFAEFGARVLEIYENCPVDGEQIRMQVPKTEFSDMVFSCSSAVRATVEAFGTEVLHNSRCFSIGKKTSETLYKYGIVPVQAERATLQSLADAVITGGNQ